MWVFTWHDKEKVFLVKIMSLKYWNLQLCSLPVTYGIRTQKLGVLARGLLGMKKRRAKTMGMEEWMVGQVFLTSMEWGMVGRVCNPLANVGIIVFLVLGSCVLFLFLFYYFRIFYYLERSMHPWGRFKSDYYFIHIRNKKWFVWMVWICS